MKYLPIKNIAIKLSLQISTMLSMNVKSPITILIKTDVLEYNSWEGTSLGNLELTYSRVSTWNTDPIKLMIPAALVPFPT